MREGSEVVLFLTGLAMQDQGRALGLALGSAGGLALGVAVSAVVYTGLLAVPLKRVFTVTGVLVTLLAAGLAAEAVRQLSNAALVTVWDRPLWDTSWLLAENGWAGRVLHVLIGYVDRPTGAQLVAYALTAGVIVLLATVARAQPPSAAPTRQEISTSST
jgi:high-affinity iron transporter